MGRKWETLFFAMVLILGASAGMTEDLFVDSEKGHDSGPGNRSHPFKTLERAVAAVNSNVSDGPTTIVIAAGLHVLGSSVVVRNLRQYTQEERLTIRAEVLPNESKWTPHHMPVLVSTQKGSDDGEGLAARGLTIAIDHVTVSGLKFLGSPAPASRYYAIWREGKARKDLVVSQSVFVGDPHSAPLQAGVIANGHRLVVERCIFLNVNNGVVFWNAEGGDSQGNAMRHCIVSGALFSGVWTCETDEDFEFHHNIITGSRYGWVRETGSSRSYRVRQSILTENQSLAGFGSGPNGPHGTASPAFIIKDDNVVTEGKIHLDQDPESRTHLHVVSGTLGSELGAGLFGPITAKRGGS
jgi:hypothetical protein